MYHAYGECCCELIGRQVVIPIQFVFFTLSAIIGSAILYGDFKRATFHQMLTFLYGCAATFLGVFIIAWSPPDDSLDAQDEDYEAGTNMERVERSLRPGERSGHGNSAGITTRNLGRRKVAMVSPIGSPILRRRPSSISVIGLSPAQVSCWFEVVSGTVLIRSRAASALSAYAPTRPA